MSPDLKKACDHFVRALGGCTADNLPEGIVLGAIGVLAMQLFAQSPANKDRAELLEEWIDLVRDGAEEHWAKNQPKQEVKK